MRLALRALLIVVALLGGVTWVHAPAVADRTSADFFVQRGDKALKEKKWSEAQEHFKRALEEDEHHVAARVGLGDAFLGAGNRAAAIEAWRKAVAAGDATKPFPAAWTEPLARARKRLAEMDAAGNALAQIVDKHVEALVALADRWASKDPPVAAKALRDALKLRPGHTKAAAAFEKMGSPTGDWIPLFNGRNFDGWDLSDDIKVWTIEDGQMVVDIAGSGTLHMAHKRIFKGDFDIRVEAKILEIREGLCVFAIGGARKSPVLGSLLGVINGGGFELLEQDGAEREAQKSTYTGSIANLPKPFDPAEWTTYELQYRGKSLHVLVNGEEEFVRDREPGRDSGAVSLITSMVRAAVRKVEAMQR